PDIAASKARQWFDEKNLDMLIAGANSAASVAMAHVAGAKQKPYLVVGGGSSAVTNDACTPYTVHYGYDTKSLANGTARAMVENGYKSWFYIASDYVFGRTLEQEARKAVEESGGDNLGSVKAPLNTTDFASYLIQAQNSGADVLGLANAGSDFVNAAKTAVQFGITDTMKLVGFLVFITEVDSLGLENTAGLYLTTAWYWDLNDATREWTERFEQK